MTWEQRPAVPRAERLARHAPLPAELADRLGKTWGHMNAMYRWLHVDAGRGLWSGRQAAARLAEIALRLRGLLPPLPRAKNKLPTDRADARLEALEQGLEPGRLRQAWARLAEAEAILLRDAVPGGRTDRRGRPVLLAGTADGATYRTALRVFLAAVVAELADRFPPCREMPDAAVIEAIQDSPSGSLVDVMHANGAVPDPAHCAARVAAEICRVLEHRTQAEELLFACRRGMTPAEVLAALGLDRPDLTARDDPATGFASVLTLAGDPPRPRHLVVVAGRWEAQACLAELHRLRRLVNGCRPDGSPMTSLRFAVFYCCHTHDAARNDPPCDSWPGDPPSLSDLIEAAVPEAFGSLCPSGGLPRPMLPEMDCGGSDIEAWQPFPGDGRGEITCAFLRFDPPLGQAGP